MPAESLELRHTIRLIHELDRFRKKPLRKVIRGGFFLIVRFVGEIFRPSGLNGTGCFVFLKQRRTIVEQQHSQQLIALVREPGRARIGPGDDAAISALVAEKCPVSPV